MPFKTSKEPKALEEELIFACQRNERRAQFHLFNLYSAKFLGIALRFAGNYDTANDILQEAFIRIFHRIGDFKFLGSFEGWMKRILIRTSIDYMKKQNALCFEELNEEYDVEFAELPWTIEKMNCAAIIHEITCLPAGYRTILNLYAIEGYSYSEIAEMLGIQEVTVRSQYLRAKQRLAKTLEKKNIAHYVRKIV